MNYPFTQEDGALTGTWQAAQSPTVQISDGRVKGDKVSFIVKMSPNGRLVFAHEGKIDGDQIQLAMKPSGDFPGSTAVARKVR